MAHPTPRVIERAGFAVPVKLRLLEADADEHDVMFDRIDTRLEKILGRQSAAVWTTATSAVLLALNLVMSWRG